MKFIIHLLLCLLLSAAGTAQQTITGATITGQVEDSSGAVVVAASVIAVNVATAQQWEQKTDHLGQFRFGALPPGDYLLKVDAQGFAKSKTNMHLSAGQTFDLHVPVKVGSSASVGVDGECMTCMPAVETTRTQLSELVTTNEVRNLPLNGRNYLDLAILVPGMSRTNTGAPQRFAETSAVPGSGLSSAGQRNLNNTFLIDGLSANDDAAELAGTFYSQEVINEFQVVTNGALPEYGRSSGAVISISSKAGSNRYHGDAYGYFRNQRLDANNPLATTKLPLTQGQYGASLGGPIVRDHTWFFANVEQTRQNSAGVITVTPANLIAINNRLTATAYRGPQISTGEFSNNLHGTNLFARVDQSVGVRERFSVRYSLYDVDSLRARNVGGLSTVSRGADLFNRDNTVAFNNTFTISPTILMENRFQYTRNRLQAPVADATGPAVNISGVASFGTATFSPTAREIDLFQSTNDVAISHGKHTFKVGEDFLHNHAAIAFPGAVQGVYTFSSLATFLSGNYVNFQQAFGPPNTDQSNPNLGIFAQDEWRIRPNLTLDLGVRYDLQYLPAPVITDTNNVAPRVGIAWDPFNDGKTVVRASYGLYYDLIPLRAVSNALQRDGINYKVAQVTPTTPGAPLFPNVLAAFPAGILTNITTIDPNIQGSYSTQAGLEVERELAPEFSVGLGYDHLRGRELIMSRNLNIPTTTNPAVFNLGRPNAAFANNGQFQSIGDSWYDGLTVSLNQRPRSWGSARVSYTFSKSLDDSGNFFFSAPQDNANILADKGRSDNDQRHRLTISGVLNSPGKKNDAASWTQLYRDWKVSYVYVFTSSLPFNLQAGSDLNGDSNANDRPAGVGRNTGEAFPFQSLDMRLSRTFHFGEKWSAEAMLDGFNILNHANFQVPNATFGTGAAPRAGFGSLTVGGDPRQLQIGLRIAF